MAASLVSPHTPAEDFGDLQPIVEALRAAGDITGGNNTFADSIAQIPAAAGGSTSDIVDELKSIEKGPRGSTDNKKAPPATSVCILPDDRKAAEENYAMLMDANSIAQLYTSLWSAAERKGRGHPEPYDITIASEAAQAFADQASSAYNVMSEGLAGHFNFVDGRNCRMRRKLSKPELHESFLKEIFQEFNLDKKAQDVLDVALTKFVESVANFSVSAETTSNTVDHSLRILHCVRRLDITGDGDKNAKYVYQPRVRIVYMRLSDRTYSWATKKADHMSSSFDMDYTIADFDLNIDKFKSSKTKLEQIWNKLSGTNLTEWSKKVTGQAVQGY